MFELIVFCIVFPILMVVNPPKKKVEAPPQVKIEQPAQTQEVLNAK